MYRCVRGLPLSELRAGEGCLIVPWVRYGIDGSLVLSSPLEVWSSLQSRWCINPKCMWRYWSRMEDCWRSQKRSIVLLAFCSYIWKRAVWVWCLGCFCYFTAVNYMYWHRLVLFLSHCILTSEISRVSLQLDWLEISVLVAQCLITLSFPSRCKS